MVTTNYILIINVNLNTARDVKEFVNFLFFAKTNLEAIMRGDLKPKAKFEKVPLDKERLMMLRQFVRDLVVELEDRCSLTIAELQEQNLDHYSFSFDGKRSFAFETLLDFVLEVLADYSKFTDHPDLKYFEGIFESFMDKLDTVNPYKILGV